MKNKKSIFIFVITVCVAVVSIVFLTLSNTGYELSVTNAETKEKITLGESRESIENKIGKSREISDFLNAEIFSYMNEAISIVYDSNDNAALIRCTNDVYSVLNDINVGDEIKVLKQTLGKNADKLQNKTLFLSGDSEKCKAISMSDVKEKISASGYEDIYVLDFGSSTTDKTVEHIMICGYTASMGIIK